MLTDQDIIALGRPDSTCNSSDDKPEAFIDFYLCFALKFIYCDKSYVYNVPL